MAPVVIYALNEYFNAVYPYVKDILYIMLVVNDTY